MTLELDKEVKHDKLSPYNRFLFGLKAPETRRQYPKRFEVFLKFCMITGFTIEEKVFTLYLKASSEPEWLEDLLIQFIMHQRDRASKGEITESTIPNYYKPVKLFCDMNGIFVNWKLISRGMPKGKSAANDRAPTTEEIIQLLKYPDIRLKPIVLVMISSGIRIGAWDYLRWKHIIPMEINDSMVAAKIIVYADQPEQYFSIITPEAHKALKEWIDFRTSYGEKITDNSWVMRDLWRTTNITYGAKLGYAKSPIKFQSNGIRNLIAKALFQQNVRPLLREGQRRHEFKAAHGFRKFFKTKTEQVMKTSNVEMLIGHSLGISKSYYKPLDEEILQDYLKAVDSLTILESNDIRNMNKELENLREKNEINEYMIKARLQEKDDALTSLSDQVMQLTEQIEKIKRIIPDEKK